MYIPLQKNKSKAVQGCSSILSPWFSILRFPHLVHIPASEEIKERKAHLFPFKEDALEGLYIFLTSHWPKQSHGLGNVVF